MCSSNYFNGQIFGLLVNSNSHILPERLRKRKNESMGEEVVLGNNLILTTTNPFNIIGVRI